VRQEEIDTRLRESLPRTKGLGLSDGNKYAIHLERRRNLFGELGVRFDRGAKAAQNNTPQASSKVLGRKISSGVRTA
jgi:hypothetical protein